MQLSPQEIANLKKNLNAARSGPVNFAACLGNTADAMILLLDRSKSPRSLLGVVKTQGETHKTICGDLEVDNGRAIFKCEAEPVSGALPQLKKFFDTHRLGFSPEFWVDMEQDIRDGEDAGSSMDAATEMSVELKAWRKMDAQIEAKVRKLREAGVKPPSKGMAAWKELRKHAQRGELRWSLARAPQVIKLLDPPKAPQRRGSMTMLQRVQQVVARLKGKMTPQQEKYLRAAAAEAKRGHDDKAAALLKAAGKGN